MGETGGGRKLVLIKRLISTKTRVQFPSTRVEVGGGVTSGIKDGCHSRVYYYKLNVRRFDPSNKTRRVLIDLKLVPFSI